MVFAFRSALALGLFAILACRAASATPRFDPVPYLHTQKRVAVGNGRHLNIYCTGRGSPAVVLDTSGDDGTAGWRLVQPEIARHTRVCSYDPAGLGFSDAVAGARDAGTSAAELHELLRRAGVVAPVVLVGYAGSGLSARLYADRYPHDVAGLVLVAPDVPYQQQRISAIAPALEPALANGARFAERCLAAAKRGAIRKDSPFAECMYAPPDPTMPAVLRNAIAKQWMRPSLWSVMVAREHGKDLSSAEVTREQRGYGRMPLVVLTTTKDILMLPIPPAQRQRLAQAWMRWHDAVAALSSRGRNRLIEDAGQALPIERPAAVSAAIEGVLEASRRR